MNPHETSPTRTPDAAARRPRPWGRVAMVVVVLVASGLVRGRQERRVEAALAGGRESPFPLATIPEILGDWVGTPIEMDARLVEATGSSDHITRRYIDQRTGVAVDAIVLYGPTSDIFIHSPELCYPKAGYAQAGETYDRRVASGGIDVPVRSLAFQKGDPSQPERQEVYFSWRYNGRWSTSVSSPKQSERIPGMYKVQVARRISPRESRTIDNPCEDFLGALFPDLESRIAGRSSPAVATADVPRTPQR